MQVVEDLLEGLSQSELRCLNLDGLDVNDYDSIRVEKVVILEDLEKVVVGLVELVEEVITGRALGSSSKTLHSHC